MNNTNVFVSKSQDSSAAGHAEPVVRHRLPVGVGSQAPSLTTAHISPLHLSEIRIAENDNPHIVIRNDAVSSVDSTNQIRFVSQASNVRVVSDLEHTQRTGLYTITCDELKHPIDVWSFPTAQNGYIFQLFASYYNPDKERQIIVDGHYHFVTSMVFSVADLNAHAAPGYTPQFEGSFEIYAGGTLVKAKMSPRNHLRLGAGRAGGGLRGQVEGFSEASRRRLRNTLGKTLRDVIPTLVTLTYPNEWPLDSQRWKRDLDVFQKRLLRRFPHCSGVWKMEPQQRGAPHFHLLVWGAELVQLGLWCSRAWYEVVDSGDEKHLAHGAVIEPIRTWRGTKSYVAKYLGKVITRKEESEDNPWAFPGRWWGMFGAKSIPWAEKITALLPRAEVTLLIRTMRKYAFKRGDKKANRRRRRDYFSLSILVNDATWWFENLNKLVCWAGAA